MHVCMKDGLKTDKSIDFDAPALSQNRIYHYLKQSIEICEIKIDFTSMTVMTRDNT